MAAIIFSDRSHPPPRRARGCSLAGKNVKEAMHTLVEHFIQPTFLIMGHLQQFEVELRARLEQGDVEALVGWLKEQVLQSYRNGLSTGAAGREELSARPGAHAKDALHKVAEA